MNNEVVRNPSTTLAHSSFLRTAERLLLGFALLTTEGDLGVSLAAVLGLRGAAILGALTNEWAHLGVATWLGHTREVWTLPTSRAIARCAYTPRRSCR